MAHVGIRDLSRNPSKVVEEVSNSGRPALVTKHGKPIVAIVPIDEDALEDWVLENAPSFVEARRAAERELAAGETVDLEDFLIDLPSDQN